MNQKKSVKEDGTKRLETCAGKTCKQGWVTKWVEQIEKVDNKGDTKTRCKKLVTT